MDEFSEIIKLRNQGLTQRKIALVLNKSEKTIRKYLRAGKVPEYKKKEGPSVFEPFRNRSIELYKIYPELTVSRLHEELKKEGYSGSYRTLTRETADIRKELKKKPLYFRRKHSPGKYMEGDFTQINDIPIGGKLMKLKLWGTILTYSNTIWVTPFFNETFESFAEGTIEAFKEFNGIAQTYRLDNFKPVVFKILKKERILTKRFREFQDHYDFKVEFCNPASGWEKGDIESSLRHIKRAIKEEINLYNLSFKDLNSFRLFLHDLCRKRNNRVEIVGKRKEEYLATIPATHLSPYRPYIVKVNKFSMFKWEGGENEYSAPSRYVGCNLEARVSSSKVELFWQGKKVGVHERVYDSGKSTIIDIEHLIRPLSEKPGAAIDWEYKDLLFSRPIWKRFFLKLQSQSEDTALSEHIKCLELMTKYGKETLNAAMELLLEENTFISKKRLDDLLSNNQFDPSKMVPKRRNLLEYDNLLKSRG